MQFSDLRGEPEPDFILPVWEALKANVRERPNHLAISCLHQPANIYGLASQRLDSRPEYKSNPWLRWTYKTLFEGISRLMKGLETRGTEKGTPIFTFVGNCAESTLCLWASHGGNYCYVPLHPENLTNRTEITHMVNTARSYLPQARPVVVAGDAAVAQQIDAQGLLSDALKIIVSGEAQDGWVPFSDLLENVEVKEEDLLPKAIEPGHEKMFYFTSGSTALPKGCVWEYPRSALSVQRFLQSSSHIHENSRVFVPLPNNHTAAYITILPFIYRGAATVFDRAFDPETIVRGMYVESCTDVLAVPTMTHALSMARAALNIQLPDLTVALAGSPCSSVHVRECLEGLGAKRVENSWGMTECIQIKTGAFTDATPFLNGTDVSVGKVPLGARVRICESDDYSPVPFGVPGELHVSSRTIIPEYIGVEGNGDFYFDNEGTRWFRTGDRAYADENGNIFIAGRYKEVIIRGGENISPVAIETAMAKDSRLDGVQIHVAGAPDAIAGRVPVVVVKGEHNPNTFDYVRATVLEQMGLKYVPSELLKLEDLGLEDWPRTPIGKLQRVKLSARVAEHIEKREEASAATETLSDTMSVPDKVKAIWASTIGVEPDCLPMEEPFQTFADSIVLMRVRARVAKETGRMMTLVEMQQAATITKQLEVLESKPVQAPGAAAKKPRTKPSVEAAVARLDSSQESSISGTLQGLGFSLQNDVEDIIPVSDINEVVSRREAFNGWAFSSVLVAKNMNSTAIEACIRRMLTDHPLLISCCARTAADKAFHVIMKQNELVLGKIIHQSGTLKTKQDLLDVPRAYPAPRGPTALPGPMLYVEIFDIEETSSAGIVLTTNHLVMDATYTNMFLEDLDALVGGGNIAEHTYYGVWSESYESLRNTEEAQAAVTWHVDRLRELRSHLPAFWPQPQPYVGPQIREAHSFRCAGIPDIRRRHANIAPPTIFKAAQALATAKVTGYTHVAFATCENSRAVLPFTPTSKRHLLENEAADVAGPTYSLIYELFEIRGDETVLGMLHRIQGLQENWTKYATAPWHDVLAQLGDSSELVERQICTLYFNWLPGMAENTQSEPYKNMEFLDSYSGLSEGLEIDCGLGGGENLDEALISLLGTNLNEQEMRDFLSKVETAFRFICSSENWDKPIKGLWAGATQTEEAQEKAEGFPSPLVRVSELQGRG